MNGLGGAAGVLFGGVITQELTWRWVLLINPPIGVAAAVVAYAVVERPPPAPRTRSFDLAGALTLTIGQMVLVYGVVEAGLAGLERGERARPDHRRRRRCWRVRADRGALRLRAAGALQGADASRCATPTTSCCCSAPRCSRCGSSARSTCSRCSASRRCTPA